MIFILNADYVAFENCFAARSLQMYKGEICFVIEHIHPDKGRSLILHPRFGLCKTFISDCRGKIIKTGT